MKLSLAAAQATALLACLSLGVLAQDPSPSRAAPGASVSTPPSSPSATPLLSTFTSTTTLSPGQQALPSGLSASASRSGSVYFVPFVSTIPPTPTSSAPSATETSSTVAATATPTFATSNKLPLDTRIDPAFGVLGALLLITGLPMTFYGHRNRWSSYFIAGYYSLALITICIILKVGVEPAINPPSRSVRGLFLLATIIAGAVGGILCIVFWQAAALLASALGGFAFGLFLQAIRSGGLIPSIGLRFVLYAGLSSAFFALSCAERIHLLVLAVATAITGATAVTLAIDCFTRQGLKEFYVRNLGFDPLFTNKYPPTFQNGRFPLVQGMQIELGVLGALIVMGTAFQLRLWSDLRHSLAVLKKSDEERSMRSKAERAARAVARTAKRDLEEWEKRHGYKKTAGRQAATDEERGDWSKEATSLADHGRKASLMSMIRGSADATPLSYYGGERIDSPGACSVLKDSNDIPFPTDRAAVRRNSSFMSYLQRGPEKPPGDAPPQLELAGITADPPSASVPLQVRPLSEAQADSAATVEQRKLLEEISTIRKSIEMLRAGSSGGSLPSGTPTSAAPLPAFVLPVDASSVGVPATRSLDLSRNLCSQASPSLPAQSFRDRTNSTAAIMSGSASFLSKSPITSPTIPSFSQKTAVAPGGPSQSHPSTSDLANDDENTAPQSGVPGQHANLPSEGPASVRAGSPAPAMSRSASDTLPSMPTASVEMPTQTFEAFPASRCIPALPSDDQKGAEPSYVHERRKSSGEMLSNPERAGEIGDLARFRTDSVTQEPFHSRVLARSMDTPMAAASVARRSIAARRSDVPVVPWTNPGMRSHGPARPSQDSRVEKPRRKSMTIEELDARHRAKLAALQKPATELMKEVELLQSVKEEFERKQRLEKRRMMDRERERMQALNGVVGASAIRNSQEGATSADPDRRQSRRLSASLLQAVGEESLGGLDRAAAWSRSISKVRQVDPALGRASQPSSQLASTPDSTAVPAGTHGGLGQRGEPATQSQSRSGPSMAQDPSALGAVNPFPAQSQKKRELNETDRRRLSQGAGGGDRRSRRLSQPLLEFTVPIAESS